MAGISVTNICIPFGGAGSPWNFADIISATVEDANPSDVVLTFPTAKPSVGTAEAEESSVYRLL